MPHNRKLTSQTRLGQTALCPLSLGSLGKCKYFSVDHFLPFNHSLSTFIIGNNNHLQFFTKPYPASSNWHQSTPYELFYLMSPWILQDGNS